jgi:hypothetical protein
MRWMVGVALAAVCAGCAPQGPSKLDVKLASMVGESETDVVRQFGVPMRTIETGGHRFIAYFESRQQLVPGVGPWGPPWWGWSGSAVITRSCEVTFEIDAGKVKGYSLRGDGCG